MTGQEKLDHFKKTIQNWMESRNFKSVKRPCDDSRISDILNMDSDRMRSLTSGECLMMAYELYAYAEYVGHEINKEQNVLEWADASIWYIISDIVGQYGGQYAKWQEKYYSAVKENPLASEILVVKVAAEARVRTLEGTCARIGKMAEILNSLARRKQ